MPQGAFGTQFFFKQLFGPIKRCFVAIRIGDQSPKHLFDGRLGKQNNLLLALGWSDRLNDSRCALSNTRRSVTKNKSQTL